MPRYDATVKAKAIELRLNGKSYSQIKNELGISSKGTISWWFKDLILPPESLKLLENNISIATEKGLLEFNIQRTQRIIDENAEAVRQGKSLVGSLTQRELMLVGATLYWGEGTKRAGVGKTSRLVFTNSDPKMIQVFLRFLREVLFIPEEKIGGELHLYENIDHDEAKEYWSNITGIPCNKFWSTNLVSRSSEGKRPMNRLPYGTIAIRVSGRHLFHKVMGIIEGLTE